MAERDWEAEYDYFTSSSSLWQQATTGTTPSLSWGTFRFLDATGLTTTESLKWAAFTNYLPSYTIPLYQATISTPVTFPSTPVYLTATGESLTPPSYSTSETPPEEQKKDYTLLIVVGIIVVILIFALVK